MFMKICAFGLHPEVWVVAWNMIFYWSDCGKKMDDNEEGTGKSILDQPTVLGELYDFQMQLLSFSGVSPLLQNAKYILSSAEWAGFPRMVSMSARLPRLLNISPIQNPSSLLPKRRNQTRRHHRPPDTLPVSLIMFYTRFKMKMHECSQRGWGGEQW